MRNQNECTNEITLVGTVMDDIQFSHKRDGNGRIEKFYQFSMQVNRLSGLADNIPVIVSELIVPTKNEINTRLTVIGSIRTRNKDGKLFVYVFAEDIQAAATDEDINEVVFDGFVCRKPTLRQTPRGRNITDLCLACNMRYKTCYIPTIVWGRLAYISEPLELGTKLKVQGRFQSRKYTKNIGSDDNSEPLTEERVAYEVSAFNITF